MSPARRSATMLAVLLLAMVLYGLWYALLRTPSTPDGYDFPHHSLSGGPDALYEGTLLESEGCVVTEAGDTVVWPGGYWLELRSDGSLAVHGDGREVAVGDAVRLGGGYYDRDGLLGIGATEATEAGCPEGTDGYFLTTGWGDEAD
jgi:hypothetical protein